MYLKVYPEVFRISTVQKLTELCAKVEKKFTSHLDCLFFVTILALRMT